MLFQQSAASANDLTADCVVTTGVWQSATPAPNGHIEGAAAVVNGKVFLISGFGSIEGYQLLATNKIDVYDPATDTWEVRNPAPFSASHIQAAVAGTEVWIAGGFIGDNPGPATDVVWRYNTITDTWRTGPALPEPRASGGFVHVNGKLHYIGGLNPDRQTDEPTHWVLDLSDIAAGWQNAAPFPRPRNHFQAVALDGIIYTVAGQVGHDVTNEDTKWLDAYDTRTGEWTQLADLPMLRSHLETGTFVMYDRIIAAGGKSGGRQGINWGTEYLTQYDPATDTWVAMRDLPDLLYTPTTGEVNGQLVVTAGGNKWNIFQSNTWLSQITEDCQPEPINETPLYRINAGASQPLDYNGQTWEADAYFTAGNAANRPSEITNSDDLVYEFERSSSADDAGFSYDFPVANGTYTIKLHFAELWWTGQDGRGATSGPGNRVFDVLVEDALMLDNYDITAAAGAPLTAVVETLANISVQDGNLDIDFPPAVVDRPSLAAIEVMQMEANQLPTANAGSYVIIADTDGQIGENVTLDGSASFDPDGSIANYAWRINGALIIDNRANPQVRLDDGENTISLVVTDDDGGRSTAATTTITVLAPNRIDTCGPLLREAEDGVFSGAFVGVAEAAASNGQYIHVPDGAIGYANAGSVHQVAYCFGVTTPGTYQLRARFYADSYTNDSFWVTLNGQTALWDLLVTSSWQEGFVTDRESGEPVEVTLSAGDQEVVVYAREDGARLDWLELVPVSITEPTPEPSNQAPTADAGTYPAIMDTDGQPGESITLDGLGSSDPDGTVVSYQWMVNGALVIEGSATPNVALNDGENTISLIVTDDDGTQSAPANVTITVEAPSVGETCGPLLREAESGAISGAFVAVSDGTASNGQYIHVPDGAIGYANAGSVHQVAYCFGVTTPGTYQLRARFYADSYTNDSFWVTLNGQTALWDLLVTSSWQEGFVTDRESGEPVEVTLSAGDQEVGVYAREDGARLDWLELVPVSITEPTPEPSNQAPTADAGTYPAIMDTDSQPGESITLDGLGSSDPDGTVVSYIWTVNGVVVPDNSATPTVALNDGQNSVSLIVQDDDSAQSSIVNTTITVSSPAATPAPDTMLYLIDSGSTSDVNYDGVVWSADQNFIGGKYSTLASTITNSGLPVYETERSSNSDDAGFSYGFALPDGVTSVTVKLHFAEIWWTGESGRGSNAGPGNRVFDVLIEDTLVLDNYDVTAAAGAPLTAVIETFEAVSVMDGVLNITFPPGIVDRPTVAAIEVIAVNGQ